MGYASGPTCVCFIGKDENKGKVHLESARFKPYTLSFIEHCKIKVFKLSITPANGNGSEPKKSMQRDLTAKVLLLLSKCSYWQLWMHGGNPPIMHSLHKRSLVYIHNWCYICRSFPRGVSHMQKFLRVTLHMQVFPEECYIFSDPFQAGPLITLIQRLSRTFLSP